MKLLEEESKNNSERWLLTYSDLITLLMIFFVVMFAISNINAQKFARLAQTLNNSFSGSKYVLEGSEGTSMVQGYHAPPADTIQETDENPFSKVQQTLSEFIKENHLEGMVTQYVDERGLVISLNNALLFDSASADLHPGQIKTVVKIGEILKVLPNYIHVEGHTDNLPIHNAEFPSNWELSVIRAINVVQIFVAQAKIAPDKISAVGYGEYRPMVPNTSDANRRLNRRVDIVIMNKEYNKWEPTGKE